MYKQDVIQYYGTIVALAEVLGISPAAISQWKDVIPECQAYRLERITNNQLMVNPELYIKIMLLTNLKAHLNPECAVVYQEISALCGSNIQAAAMLSKFIYWTETIENKPERNGWIFKTAVDLKHELGLTRRGYEKARQFLLEKGIIQYRRGGVHGKMHWRINIEHLLQQIYIKIKGQAVPKDFFSTQIDIDNYPLPRWVLIKEWNAYVQMRQEQGKTLSNKQKRKLVDQLKQLKSSYDLKVIIDRSTMGGWIHFYAPDTAPSSPQQAPNDIAATQLLHQQQAAAQSVKKTIQNNPPKPPPRNPESDARQRAMMANIINLLKQKR